MIKFKTIPTIWEERTDKFKPDIEKYKEKMGRWQRGYARDCRSRFIRVQIPTYPLS